MNYFDNRQIPPTMMIKRRLKSHHGCIEDAPKSNPRLTSSTKHWDLKQEKTTTKEKGKARAS